MNFAVVVDGNFVGLVLGLFATLGCLGYLGVLIALGTTGEEKSKGGRNE